MLLAMQPLAARLAQIRRRMQRSGAALARPRSDGLGKFAIDGEEQLMEFGVGQQSLVQSSLSFLGKG